MNHGRLKSLKVIYRQCSVTVFIEQEVLSIFFFLVIINQSVV